MSTDKSKYNFNIIPKHDALYYYKKRPKSSCKDIQVTSHAMARSAERLNITKKDELKKLSNVARHKGVNITLIRQENYFKFGLTYDEYKYIRERFFKETQSTDIYIYKGVIFVFCGTRKKILKTVINLKLLI